MYYIVDVSKAFDQASQFYGCIMEQYNGTVNAIFVSSLIEDSIYLQANPSMNSFVYLIFS